MSTMAQAEGGEPPPNPVSSGAGDRECPICCLEYTRCLRRSIACAYCAERACKLCWQRFLVGEDAPTCLFCKRAWNREFMDAAFDKMFLRGPLKYKRQDVLVSLEESLLPDTQEAAKASKTRDEMLVRKRAIAEREKKAYADLVKYFRFPETEQEDGRTCVDAQAECARIRDELGEVCAEIARLNQIIDGTLDPAAEGGAVATSSSASRRQFVARCAADNCNGFVSSDEHACGLCGTKVCSQCLHAMTDGHECDPAEVASAKALRKDTKACPNCSVLIHKIDGCFGAGVSIKTYDGSPVDSQDVAVGHVLVAPDGSPRRVVDCVAGHDYLFEVSSSSSSSSSSSLSPSTDKYVVSSKHVLVLKPTARMTAVFRGGDVGDDNHFFDIEWVEPVDLVLCKESFRGDDETQAHAFVDALREDLVRCDVEVTADDFVKLPEAVRDLLMGRRRREGRGAKKEDEDKDEDEDEGEELVPIAVRPVGRGAYWGWTLQGGALFLLSDGTVVHNCDQMWCTRCNTAFSWRTLRIETGRIHNPHWYEWQRQQSRDGQIAREPGDEPCRDALHLPSYQRLLRTGRMTIRLETAHQLLVHVQYAELPRYRALHNNARDNKDLRIKFLLGKMSRDAWKRLLQEREKRREKEQAMRHALEVLLYGSIDIWRAFAAREGYLPASSTEEQLDALRVYTNECVATVIKRFDCSFKFVIDDDWCLDC